MGWEHEPGTVWKAQEMYCVDRMSFDAVAESLGVAASTLKRWADKYGWRAKREEIAQTESEIRADFVRARSGMLKKLIADKGAQDAFAVASLENLALARERATQKAGTLSAAAAPTRKITTPGEAVDALSDAVSTKLNMMLSDPALVDFKAIKDLRAAMEMIARMRSESAEQRPTTRTKGLSDQAVKQIEELLGYQA